jgi:hypothetical protein
MNSAAEIRFRDVMNQSSLLAGMQTAHGLFKKDLPRYEGMVGHEAKLVQSFQNFAKGRILLFLPPR